MDIQFLGGASYVGALGMILMHEGERILFDYGFVPTNPPKYPAEAPPVKVAFLSHAHVDHSGMIPWLCGRYRAEVIATPPTIGISDLLVVDSLKVTEMEGYPKPFTSEDIEAARRSFRPVEFGDTLNINGLEISVHSGGHIPGASMFEINDDKTVLFTGDINTVDTELVRRAEPVKCDVLIIESTYAGRYHPPRPKLREEFLEKIEDVSGRGGVVIVPAFAVGRTQEILMMLQGEGFEVWVDGMGKTVNRLYLNWPRYLRSVKHLKQAMKETRVARTVRQRAEAINGEVVVTTSGMLDGGPVLWYVQRILEDRRSAILLTGYQVEGTNGRRLLDEGQIDLWGALIPVSSEVGFFDFSAHAGHAEILDFIERCDPSKVILCHGENRELIAKEIEGREVVMPMEGQILTI